MFINCPNCSALVATDLATDLPPERCPRCSFGPLVRQVRLEVPAPEPAPEPAPAPDAAPAPAAADAAAPAPAPAPAPETAPEPAVQPEPEPGPAAEPGPASDPEPVPGPTPPDPDPPAAATATAPPPAPGRPAPRFVHRRGPATGVRADRRQIAVAAGLALLLVAQLLLADRARLAADAGWRPVVATLCGALRCGLPPWREPAAIAVEQRDVRPLPGRQGVLRVSATIRNDARWPQAWPRLTLTLSDVDGRALGMRAFEPAEYLTSPPQHVTVASGESAAISMDIVEPSPHAVAFNFSFD